MCSAVPRPIADFHNLSLFPWKQQEVSQREGSGGGETRGGERSIRLYSAYADSKKNCKAMWDPQEKTPDSTQKGARCQRIIWVTRHLGCVCVRACELGPGEEGRAHTPLI